MKSAIFLIMEFMIQNALLKLSFDILGVDFHRASENFQFFNYNL